jgi:hypothetical protein
MVERTPNFRQWTRSAKIVAAVLTALLLAPPLLIWELMIRMPGTSYRGALQPLSPGEIESVPRLRATLHALSGVIGERLFPISLAPTSGLVQVGLSRV